MPKKVTAKDLKAEVDEFLGLQAAVKRAEKLKDEIKAGMKALKFQEVAVEGKGRVWLSISTRSSVPVALVREVLPRRLAKKVIQESVSNEAIKSLVTLGEIDEEQRQTLLNGADKTEVKSLQVQSLFK